MQAEFTWTEKRGHRRSRLNEHGVALIIVLLVTALLIALIFEFAYGTRVSLRAAVNYRNSERAHYLARSGVNMAGVVLHTLMTSATGSNLALITNATVSNPKYLYLEQKIWQHMPFQAGDDAKVDVRWDDEAAKLRINDVANIYRRAMVRQLFENKGIDRTVLDRMIENSGSIYKLKLLTELHQYMADEDFDKVSPFLTVTLTPGQGSVSNDIDINTVSPDVLMSMGISASAAGLIIEERQKNPFTPADITSYAPIGNVMIETTTSKVTNFMTDSSDFFTVYSVAKVGGYTKAVQAIIKRDAARFTVLNYWTVLDTRSIPGIEDEL